MWFVLCHVMRLFEAASTTRTAVHFEKGRGKIKRRDAEEMRHGVAWVDGGGIASIKTSKEARTEEM